MDWHENNKRFQLKNEAPVFTEVVRQVKSRNHAKSAGLPAKVLLSSWDP